jgi:hypothetical protein
MNVEAYFNLDSLYSALNINLRQFEEKWGKNDDEKSPSDRFQGLIRRAYEQTGRKVVVLIDEYDKPLLGANHELDTDNDIRNVLKGFYGVLKSADANLRFVFLTGVTKFSKVSVFSDLNHLTDISLNKKYAGICGISETELADFFKPEISDLADELGKTYDETFDELRKRYNGYHFARKSEGMYNLYSLLKTFEAGDIRNYWFETGTPTFLVRMLKDLNFDLKRLEKDVKISVDEISEYRVGSSDPVPLLFQTGYLTILGYDYNDGLEEYILGFPNEEVKYGFLRELLPMYVSGSNNLSEFYVGDFIRDLRAGKIESFMTRLKAFFAGISYELNKKKKKDYQTIFYVMFKIMGQFVEAESRSSEGRADVVIVTADFVYIFEFKLTEKASAEDALKQINETGYHIPFMASNKKIVKIGAEFGREERGLNRWVIEN